MSSRYYVYDTLTGEILRTGSCSESDVSLQPQEGESVGVGEAADDVHYVLDGKPELRIPCPYNRTKSTITADGVDEVNFYGLPANCTVIWPDEFESVINDGSIQYSVDYPGTYTFILRSPIHLERSVEVEAVPIS